MIKTLTEQWREGKLENGFYYVRSGWSTSVETRYLGNGFFEGNIEVLAPVPSYDEYKRLQEQIKEANEIISTYRCYDDTDAGKATEYCKKWGVK
jgi:alkyl sulfatase BDS1-like metallo-beta-lactamase superfamily hydrolase